MTAEALLMTSTVKPGFLRSESQLIRRAVIAALQSILRIPLFLKVMGANGLIVAVALVLVGNGLWREDQGELVVVLAALALASLVNLVLVSLALSPIAELERVARRVSRGEFTIRAARSQVADPKLAHLTETINSLLDSLAAERRRIHKLGTDVVSAQDAERAQLARDLHDSIAQTLAAVRFQLSAAGTDATDDEMRNRLAVASGMIGRAIDDVRNISQSLHPRIADDLGLVTALESLAEQTRGRGILDVRLTAALGTTPLPASVAATLFRVAQEALKSAEMRAATGSAEILLYSNDGGIRLEVTEDAHELDRQWRKADNSVSRLSSIRDRVTLSGGVLNIFSERNGGMRVTAELRTGEED
jgi:signal transduction histidine kinase